MYDNNKLMQIFGTEELVQAFKDLDSDLNDKMISASFKKSSKLLIDEIKGNLSGHKRSGRLYNSITSVYKSNVKTLTVGASRKMGGYHAHLLEFGTKERFKKNGASTGSVLGIRYFSSAVYNKSDDVFKIIQTELKNSFDKYIKNKTGK